MSSLQPLYDVKDRLESAAIAGTGLLGEDFRLQRAAEAMKPLAAASPVFGKISAGLDKLLSASAEERGGLLLDVLALVDAVVYTQGKSGMEGGLVPLSTGGGTCVTISHGQMRPLLTALTTTGGGRMEVIRSNWENHPEFFSDYRVLPAVVSGLGDSYGEIADLNAGILKKVGPAALPLLKRGFEPAGKKEMARRVEVVTALEGAGVTPWLLEVLPKAKKDVRLAVLAALGEDPGNTGLLLDLAKSERGKNREAVLSALARQDGENVQTFWASEVEKNPNSVQHLRGINTLWASDLAASALQARLEELLSIGDKITPEDKLGLQAIGQTCAGKTSPAMLNCWRWIDGMLNSGEKMQWASGQLMDISGKSADWLLDSLCYAGPGPLSDLALELWEKHRGRTRYLAHAVVAALMTRPAGEVYDEFSLYIPTAKSLNLGGTVGQSHQNAVLKGLGRIAWKENGYLVDNVWPLAEPLDLRWIERLTQAVNKSDASRPSADAYWELVPEYDLNLMQLIDPEDEATRKLLIPYLRARMEEVVRPYAYSQFLFRLGGSPKGVLGRTMERDHKSNRLGVLWNLMNDAAKALPAGEVADLLEEILASKSLHKTVRPSAEKVIPWVVEQLRAGKPFPDWDDWMRFM